MENGREPPHLLQVRPRFILFRPVPVFGERLFGERSGAPQILSGPQIFFRDKDAGHASAQSSDSLQELLRVHAVASQTLLEARNHFSVDAVVMLCGTRLEPLAQFVRDVLDRQALPS